MCVCFRRVFTESARGAQALKNAGRSPPSLLWDEYRVIEKTNQRLRTAAFTVVATVVGTVSAAAAAAYLSFILYCVRLW